MKVPKNIIIIFLIVLILSILLNIFFFIKYFKNYFLRKANLVETLVIKVIDGDTFDTKDGERIRLYEIDAPEYPKGCLSEESKNRLETMILNQKINYQRIGKDNFGRILAYVYFNKIFINEALVQEGLAYFQKAKILNENSLLLEQSQEKAKIIKRGVWSNICLTQKENCLIKGNYRSAGNTRIYHLPDCYNYDRITIKPGTSDRWFCTEVEAKAAGFRKSNDCPK